MIKPHIKISEVQLADGGAYFRATVAGYSVRLRMPREFVEDEVGNENLASYFARNDDAIKDAAWSLAYALSTKDMKPGDEPGPVPYNSILRVPFDRIVIA